MRTRRIHPAPPVALIRLKKFLARARWTSDPDAPFADRQIHRDGFDFESRFFMDGTVLVRCEVLMQTEVFRPGEGDIDLAAAERRLIDRILAENGQRKPSGDGPATPGSR